MAKTVYSHCHYCLCLCGTKITVEDNKVLSIEPDRENPHSWRDFCRKGMTAATVLEHPRRITTPMRRVGDHYEPATYAEAIEDIAARLSAIIDKHGSDAVGSYGGNPLGFSFGNISFWNALLDAIGTGNRFFVSSLDENNTHVVAHEMYGTEVLTMVPDVDDSDLFLFVAMDPSQSKFTWCESMSDGWNRVLAAQARGAEIIMVDPRRSVSVERADLHVPVLPGQDWAFLLGILHVLFAEGLDRPSERVPLSGVEHIRAVALSVSLDDLAGRCGIEKTMIIDVARRFGRAERALCLSHTGIAHTATGTLAEWLGHVINAVTNRLDQPGGKYRARGFIDLIDVWAAFAPPAVHRSRLRDMPAIAGAHSVAELADEILVPGPGQIRAMLLMAGNPVVSGPDGDVLDGAFESLELLVSIDQVQRESHRHAHWLIPGTHFLEREGVHALFSALAERPYAQKARRAVTPPPGVMEEWEFCIELALAMNRNLFGKKGVNTIVRFRKWLAKLLRNPDLRMTPETIVKTLVKSGKTISYKEIADAEHGLVFGEKEFGHIAAALRTPDKTAHCAPPKFLWALQQEIKSRKTAASPEYPMLMVNRRAREGMNSWLNETKGLFEQRRSNTVDLHPDDADALGVVAGQWVRVSSASGSVEVPVAIDDGIRRGVVTIAHGWGSRIYDPQGGAVPEQHGANRNRLVDRADFDPFSQTPAFNGVPVRVEVIEMAVGADEMPVRATAGRPALRAL